MTNISMKRSMYFQQLTLILPGLLIFTIGLVIPMFIGLYFSFTNWDGFENSPHWIGLGNYWRILNDETVRNAWGFTVSFTIWNTIIQNFLALFFAVILDGWLKAKKVYRTILFLPSLIAPLVAGFIWQRLYSDVFPAFNSIFHTHISFMLFGKPSTVLTGLLIVNNWQWVGYWMLIYLAGLQNIPGELYEAAHLDGASNRQTFFRITIPMLAPSFTICIVGITIGSLKVFDLLVSSTYGGPGRSSTSIIYQIYNAAINGRQYGYGSALSMALIVALLVVAVIQIGILRKREVQL